jgi:hypothetical protein
MLDLPLGAIQKLPSERNFILKISRKKYERIELKTVGGSKLLFLINKEKLAKKLPVQRCL